jgi:Protein of unknown function (DUF3489)
MPKLTDTQLIILSTAAQREDSAALPLPKSVKLQGGATNHVLKSLLNKGLLAEQAAGSNAAAWRKSRDGQPLMLVITDAGRAAIDVPADEQSASKESIPSRRSKRSAGPRRKAGKAKSASAPKSTAKNASSAAPRAGSKQALLVGLLRRKEGATIGEAVKATGWQPHSVRGAISGTLKKKLGLAVTSEKVEDRGRVYRVAAKR